MSKPVSSGIAGFFMQSVKLNVVVENTNKVYSGINRFNFSGSYTG
jgi:hypothetical protein